MERGDGGVSFGGPGRDRNRMPNGDGVVADQDLLDHEADDPLPVLDIKRVRRGAQPGQERREGLGEAQVGCPVVHLVHDRLQFSLHSMFAVSELRHSLAQFVERQEVLLIGCQEAVDALAGPRQVPQQGSLALLRRVGCPRRCQPAVELVLDQARILQQADDLGPDNLIEEILADRAVWPPSRRQASEPMQR